MFLNGLDVARLEQLGDQAGPAGLVRRPGAAAAVCVEILVEQNVVPKVRVVLQLRAVAEHRPAVPLVTKEETAQAACHLNGDLINREQLSGTGWAHELEGVA